MVYDMLVEDFPYSVRISCIPMHFDAQIAKWLVDYVGLDNWYFAFDSMSLDMYLRFRRERDSFLFVLRAPDFILTKD